MLTLKNVKDVKKRVSENNKLIMNKVKEKIEKRKEIFDIKNKNVDHVIIKEVNFNSSIKINFLLLVFLTLKFLLIENFLKYLSKIGEIKIEEVIIDKL